MARSPANAAQYAGYRQGGQYPKLSGEQLFQPTSWNRQGAETLRATNTMGRLVCCARASVELLTAPLAGRAAGRSRFSPNTDKHFGKSGSAMSKWERQQHVARTKCCLRAGRTLAFGMYLCSI